MFNKKNKLRKNTRYYQKNEPSWKSFTVKRKNVGTRRGPLVNIRTPRLVVSEIRLFLLKLSYNVLFLLLAVGIVYFLFFSEWLQINKVMVEGNKSTDNKLILDSVEPFLHKKVLFLFPSNNFFFVPTRQIEREIMANFKRIGKVKVSRGFPSSLAIRVEEKKAVLLFCSNGGCVWVDEEGIAYNKSSYAEALADSANVVIVQDNSNSDLVPGKLVTSPDYVDFANKLWRSFPEKMGKELAFLSTPLPSAEEIRANSKEGFLVYFDTTVPMERSLALLQRVIEQELKEKEGGVTCLDYIDLRITDRVFYKMKDNCNNGGEESQNQEENDPKNQGEEQVNPEEETKPSETVPPPKTSKKKKKS